MEKLLLRFFLAVQELDIIHKKHVCLAIPSTKIIKIPFLNRENELIGELLTCQIDDFRLRSGLENILPYRLHEMSLTEP